MSRERETRKETDTWGNEHEYIYENNERVGEIKTEVRGGILGIGGETVKVEYNNTGQETSHTKQEKRGGVLGIGAEDVEVRYDANLNEIGNSRVEERGGIFGFGTHHTRVERDKDKNEIGETHTERRGDFLGFGGKRVKVTKYKTANKNDRKSKESGRHGYKGSSYSSGGDEEPISFLLFTIPVCSIIFGIVVFVVVGALSGSAEIGGLFGTIGGWAVAILMLIEFLKSDKNRKIALGCLAVIVVIGVVGAAFSMFSSSRTKKTQKSSQVMASNESEIVEPQVTPKLVKPPQRCKLNPKSSNDLEVKLDDGREIWVKKISDKITSVEVLPADGGLRPLSEERYYAGLVPLSRKNRRLGKITADLNFAYSIELSQLFPIEPRIKKRFSVTVSDHQKPTKRATRLKGTFESGAKLNWLVDGCKFEVIKVIIDFLGHSVDGDPITWRWTSEFSEELNFSLHERWQVFEEGEIKVNRTRNIVSFSDD